MSTYIPTHEVIKRFGFLAKGKKPISGLQFALKIIRSGVDCKEFRENCASTAASDIVGLLVTKNGRCFVKEYLI